MNLNLDKKLPRLKMEHSPLLQQVSQVYTLPIFDLFQKEYDKYSVAYIKEGNESEPTHKYLVCTMIAQRHKTF